MTHSERITHAQASRTCFACAHYCGQFSLLSSVCLIGGLDPERTAAMPLDSDKRIWSTVRWTNSCPRFVAAMPMQVAA